MGRTFRLLLAWMVCLAVLAGTWGCGVFKAKGLPKAPALHGAEALAAGDAALSHGAPNDAGRYYLTALKSGADPVKTHIRLGNLYLGSGMWDKARQEYEAALKVDADNGPALQGLGFALFLGGNKGKAAEALTRALERDPGLSRAAALLGTIENRQGRPEAALAVFDKSLAVRFDPAVANNRGISLMMLGRTAEAVDAFGKALAAKKTARFANNLGLALCRERRYDEAYAAFVSVGSEAAALNNLGVCYMETGDKARAQQSFERAIAANPTYYEKAQMNLSRLSTSEEVTLPMQAPAGSETARPVVPPVSQPKVPAAVEPASAVSAVSASAPNQPVRVAPPSAGSVPLAAVAPSPVVSGVQPRPATTEQADRAEMP